MTSAANSMTCHVILEGEDEGGGQVKIGIIEPRIRTGRGGLKTERARELTWKWKWKSGNLRRCHWLSAV